MSIQQLKTEVRNELTQNILPFWMNKMADDQNGGFYGHIDGTGEVHPNADKGCVMNARILWTFSAACRVLGINEYLPYATRAKDYILTCFWDKEYGGVYWQLDHKGNVVDGKKQIYAQAFTIYALTEYYRVTKDETCLSKAIELYSLTEKYSYDPKLGGYFEAFSREWQDIGDLRLSEKDANEKKTMNTHLHVLEAYTNLYRVWKDEKFKVQYKKLIEVFASRIVNQETYNLGMFFDEHWNDKTDLVSYGHNIEASWLLYEAAHVLGNHSLTNRMKDLCIKIADVTFEGLRPDGSMVYERFFKNNHIDTDRHWWPQAESVVGYVNAFELTGKKDYLDKAVAAWNFISAHLVDRKGGEWFWSVDDNMQPNLRDDKAGFWKCPYHNSRMCFEVIERKIG
jgi:N-acyl-D-glucosamine 2-epimerase